MANTTGVAKLGTRHVRFYRRNADGTLYASGETAYAGVEMAYPQDFSLPVPQPRIFHHPGEDRVFMSDALPPTEGITGTLKVGATDLDMIALLSNVKVRTEADFKMVARATDQQGYEETFAILVYAQARDTKKGSATRGQRFWRYTLIPAALAIPGGVEYGQDRMDDQEYTVIPMTVSNHVWGEALTDEDDGCTEMQFLDLVCQNPPMIDSFKAGASTTSVDLSLEAADDTKVKVWVAGVDVTSSATILTTDGVTTVTFGTTPTEDDSIVVMYERVP